MGHVSHQTVASKNVWTKDGWQKRPANKREVSMWEMSKSRKLRYEEFNYQNPRGEMDLIQDAHNQIQTGSVGLEIDKLPQGLRNIVEQPYLWYIKGTKLFKVVDEITQVKEFGHWGSDSSDADAVTLNDKPTVSQMFLEEANIISRDETAETVTDILGDLSEDFETPDSTLSTRLDTAVTDISILPDGSEIVMRRDSRLACVALPEITGDLINNIRQIRTDFDSNMESADTEEKVEVLKLQYEQDLDREVGKEITTRLNSPYCGRGYSAPRKKYDFIPTPTVALISQAATEREAFFYQMFGEASSCDSYLDLFGPIITDNITGEQSRAGGFMGKIRGMYHADKEIKQKWSTTDRKDDNGNIIELSAFNKAKQDYIRDWREEKKGDEEKLRKSLYVQFDRIAKKVSAVIGKNGMVKKKAHSYKDSIWLQKRTIAYTKLFLTSKQWTSVYKVTDIIRKRIKLAYTEDQERVTTLNVLGKHFTRIENLADLSVYMRWAQHRKSLTAQVFSGYRKNINGSYTKNKDGNLIEKQKSIPTCDFSVSMIDRISIIDESKWRQSCAKKRNYLGQRIVLYRELTEQVKSEKETELEDVSLVCPDPKCNCMAIGSPLWFEIKDNKGLLGVRCDNDKCNRIVWKLKHKEIPIIKTYKEAINED